MSKLIQSNGKPRYGIVSEPWTEINYRDFDLRTPMNRKVGWLGKKLGYNHFQYFGVISERLIFGCAQVDMKYGGVVFCYVYNVETRTLKEWNFKDIGWWGTHTVNTPGQGTSYFKRGNKRIEFINQASPREKRLRIDFPGELQVDVMFSEAEPAFAPMCITSKVGSTGWVYAQKVAGVDCRGSVQCEFGEYDMQAINALAHHDWTGGYMRRETFWEWACFSGEVDGQRVGLNLSCGVNETSFTENCYWLDGKLIKVDTVQFDYDRDQPDSVWQISSYDGQIDLRFTPEGYHEEKQNFLLVASNFKQFFGYFSGRVGELNISKQYGFVEDQYSRW
ncbi:MAG: hypothetical protein CSA54_03580 [Gammaproteobacteria bacterium]|nr:MAG: hypothetical protein CSA54_03580 [Gammaproteobacteria bacterium]